MLVIRSFCHIVLLHRIALRGHFWFCLGSFLVSLLSLLASVFSHIVLAKCW